MHVLTVAHFSLNLVVDSCFFLYVFFFPFHRAHRSTSDSRARLGRVRPRVLAPHATAVPRLLRGRPASAEPPSASEPASESVSVAAAFARDHCGPADWRRRRHDGPFRVQMETAALCRGVVVCCGVVSGPGGADRIGRRKAAVSSRCSGFVSGRRGRSLSVHHTRSALAAPAAAVTASFIVIVLVLVVAARSAHHCDGRAL